MRSSSCPSFDLMDDNARSHRAATVDGFLESEGVARMAFSFYSKNLNSIENLRSVTGFAVHRDLPPTGTFRGLKTAVKEK